MTARDVAAQQIAVQRALLEDLGYTVDDNWRYRASNHGGAASEESFTLAVTMPGADEALALLTSYAELVGLEDDQSWSISAMPAWSGVREWKRFATISTGNIELFYVWLDADKGQVKEWGVRLDPSTMGAKSGDDISRQGGHLADWLDFISDPSHARAVRETRELRQWKRRSGWHNPWLADLVLPTTSLRPEVELTPADLSGPVHVERGYRTVLVRQRKHQRAFRELLFSHHPQQCHYCGMQVLAILEAAHLVADSRGGEASVDNGRLLCPNHHRAYDAGLLSWDGESFHQATDAPAVPPLPR